MRRHLVLLSFLLFALTGIAQSADNNEMSITKGVGTIDGQKNTYEAYNCNSSATAWMASYKDVSDSESVRIFYHKTTGDDCVISFPKGTVIPQGNGRDGVKISNLQITISSSSKGFFLIIVERNGEEYKVSCTLIGG